MPINSFENYPMTWKPCLSHTKLPLYKALAQLLEEDIQKGNLKPGDMLPPQRELADFLDINLSTVTKAFKLCEQRGLISATVGKGTFIASDVGVSSRLLHPTPVNHLIDLGAIHPTYTQNAYVLSTLQDFLTSKDASSHLEYTSTCGTQKQRMAGLKWLKNLKLSTDTNHILLASGGQNALCAILTSFFEPGDRIGTDPLIYAGFKTLAKMLGIQLVPVPQANDEISPSLLRGFCKKEGLKALYLIPDFHNPTTHTMSLATREAIAKFAKEEDLLLIEDAINSAFVHELLPPIASFAPEQTFYISSTSKSLCPALRISFIACPLRHIRTLELGLYNVNMMISPFTAQIATELIYSSMAEQILKERQSDILERNELANSIFRGYPLLGALDCNFRFLLLPEGWSGKAFEMCAKKAGVQVYCGERFAVGNAPLPAAVRLSIATPKTKEDLYKALIILKSILEQDIDLTLF
ncbi:GntR family transcriptional regulator [Sporanaerobium hydrogeniformans]|uniref:GntR family transcriptional regulator n=1 Tax=Sporanaerobium hydrogeniformans TaxID=3072179 RepID=A0AC61DBI6_9FIRM|nr:PLP-dependent aminotransferase family protein [Sporanaerobium hydrogeniformans]PHV70088.1 GntR family transcriptional regulator [Sporanaerobium hydrogeniformans]